MSAAIGPLSWPARPALLRQDRVAQLVILLPMLAYTLLSKIGIPAGATLQIPAFLPMVIMTVPIGLLSGRLQMQAENLTFFMLMAAVLLGEQALGGNAFSIASLGLLFAVHMPYCFRVKSGLVAADFHLRTFQNIALVLSVLGFIEFFAQFVIGTNLAFPVDMLLPKAIILQDFHNMNPLEYKGKVFKSNGVFLIEPSFFSQISAVALLIELTYFRRLWRIAVTLAGMAVSFSGTGIVLLGVALPVVLIKQRRFDILLAGLAGLVLFAMSADALGLGMFVNRVNEFSSTETSGFARFVGGFYLFNQYLWPDPIRSLFGFGAGSVSTYIDMADFPAWDPSWVKVPFEYGLLGAAVYFPFVFFCALRAPGALVVKTSLLVAFFVGAALMPPIHTMIISLLVWPWSAGGEPEPWRLGLFNRGRRAAPHSALA